MPLTRLSCSCLLVLCALTLHVAADPPKNPCPAHCDAESCNERDGTCDSCTDGYGFDANGSCLPCSASHCNSCFQDFTRCTENGCDKGYSLDKNQCVPCSNQESCQYCKDGNPDVCTLCKPRYGLDKKTGTCFKCSQPGCVQCELKNKKETCTSCGVDSEGYPISIVNGKCVPTCPDPNCRNCSGKNANECSSCKDKYSLDNNGRCRKCSVPHCGQCQKDSFNECLYCLTGYSVDRETGKCIKCVDHCSDCSNGKCQLCLSGYSLSNDKKTCIKCTGNGAGKHCGNCDPKDPSVCVQCNDGGDGGMGIDSKKGSCEICIKNCLKCDGDTSKCTQCETGYYYDAQANRCAACSPPCWNCDAKDPTKCSSCVKGYYIKGDACVPCPEGCNGCRNDGTCFACMTGYTLQGDKCTKN